MNTDAIYTNSLDFALQIWKLRFSMEAKEEDAYLLQELTETAMKFIGVVTEMLQKPKQSGDPEKKKSLRLRANETKVILEFLHLKEYLPQEELDSVLRDMQELCDMLESLAKANDANE